MGVSAKAWRARVLIVDDIGFSREALATLLTEHESVGDVVTAGNAVEAMHCLDEQRFDVVLLSLTTSGGLVFCAELVAAARPARVVALAVSGNDEEMVLCAEAGVAGYLLRQQSSAELVDVVTRAARGELTCPPEVAAALMRRLGPQGESQEDAVEASRLTAREREILGLIDEGLSNKEIARKLTIEVRTVKNHVHNLLEKLDVHRRADAAALLRGPRRTTQVVRALPRQRETRQA